MEEKQSVEILEPRKFGGAQPGAGRPKGTINKISASAILEAIDDTLGIPFQVQLALNYQRAIYGDDPGLTARYDQFILNKVVADKVDITSNGQSITPIIEMTTAEIPDYITVEHKEVNVQEITAKNL
jgi:hypothetical protein